MKNVLSAENVLMKNVLYLLPTLLTPPPFTIIDGELELDFCNCNSKDGFLIFTSVLISNNLVCITFNLCFIELYRYVI